MNDKNKYALLDVIHRNGSVKRLIRDGLNFNEIAINTGHLILEGLVVNSDNRIILAEKGEELLKKLELEYKKINKAEWIQKEEKSRIDKKDKTFIFVPRQSELTF